MKMIYFDRFDVAKGTDINSTIRQKNMIFVIIGIFQIKSDIAVLDINAADYCCIISGTSEAVDLLNNLILK